MSLTRKFPILSLLGLLTTTSLLSACSEPDVSLALGTLERDRITLISTAAQFITAQPVSEGTHVEAGTLIVQLDTTLQQQVLAGVHANIKAEQANLLKLQAGPRTQEIAAARAQADSARSVLAQSERDLERIQDLVSRQLAAQADMDTAGSHRDTNAAQLRAAQAQLQLLLAGSRAEDIAQSQARLEGLQAQLAVQERLLADLSLRAPRAAIVDSLPWETGERVSTGSVTAILLSATPPYARIYLPEPYRQQLKPGSTLPVHVDGSTTVYTGTVRWIALDPSFTPYYALNSAERSRLVYLTEITLPETARDLASGLPVQVELP